MAYENKDILAHKIPRATVHCKMKKKTGEVLEFEVILTYWDSDSLWIYKNP